MSQKSPQRRGLGRGLGSLIPTAPPATPSSGPADQSTDREQGPDGSADASGASGSAGPAGTTASGADESAPDATTPAPGAPENQLTPVQGAWFAEIPVSAITPNPRQPRQVFEEEAMAELVHSVTEVGLLQPVVVRPLGDEKYELIMGERRWRATEEAGLTTIPAIVRDTADEDLLRDALLENLHRAELNPLEEAAAYQQLLDDFGCTHEELAGRIGRSRPQITNTLRLLRLSPAVQRRVAAGVLSAGHARALLAVTDPATQDRLAGRVSAEGISVRGLEEIVSVGDLGSAPQPKPRGQTMSAPGLSDLSERLSDRLETRVKVSLGKSKGRISVEFASMADLERIVDIMDPRNRHDRPI